MKKLSVIIATVLFSFGVANTALAQAGQGSGINHGAALVGGVGGSTSGNNNNEASHGVNISIPTVTLVDVEGTDGEAGTINLTPDITNLEAGSAVDFSNATNKSLWLNYTSIVEDKKTRNITAAISSELHSGVSLKLLAGSISSGKGSVGESAGEITLTKTAQNLVTAIGSCYTETGNGKGHQLNYTLDMDNEKYTNLKAESYEITVTYTITD